jgi:hypothetical protein
MTEHTLAPIELTDDELLAVSGGVESVTKYIAHASISQRVSQSVGLAQLGGDLSIRNGNGNTTLTNTSFLESFNASVTQTATTTNNGSATATA